VSGIVAAVDTRRWAGTSVRPPCLRGNAGRAPSLNYTLAFALQRRKNHMNGYSGFTITRVNRGVGIRWETWPMKIFHGNLPFGFSETGNGPSRPNSLSFRLPHVSHFPSRSLHPTSHYSSMATSVTPIPVHLFTLVATKPGYPAFHCHNWPLKMEPTKSSETSSSSRNQNHQKPRNVIRITMKAWRLGYGEFMVKSLCKDCFLLGYDSV
jgi:hypothetical protein